MPTTIITSAVALFVRRALTCDWFPDFRSQSVGSATGVDQISFSAYPQWVGKPQISLHGAQIRQWRALLAYSQGRARVWRVPLVDKGNTSGDGNYWSGGIPWEGGILWAYDPIIACAAGAAAGAEQIVVQEGDYSVTVGQFISHGDWPYIVTERIVDGASTTIGVQPPLRQAIPAAASISLRAFGLFRLASDMSGNPAYDGAFHSRPTVEFQEWLGPERFA